VGRATGGKGRKGDRRIKKCLVYVPLEEVPLKANTVHTFNNYILQPLDNMADAPPPRLLSTRPDSWPRASIQPDFPCSAASSTPSPASSPPFSHPSLHEPSNSLMSRRPSRRRPPASLSDQSLRPVSAVSP
jgi:hypothetical protein